MIIVLTVTALGVLWLVGLFFILMLLRMTKLPDRIEILEPRWDHEPEEELESEPWARDPDWWKQE